MPHSLPHLSHRSTWLRASVLGANDGIISTASLIIGVASANASKENIIIAGLVGLVSGAFSMAAGEYVSVSSQTDLENADLAMEKSSIDNNFAGETAELSEIYQQRGLSKSLADQVANELMAHDPIAAHARDDIGIVLENRANPIVAAFSSALSFIIGAALPLLIAVFVQQQLTATVAVGSIVFLALLGAVSAFLGKASMLKAALRVSLWGAIAMSVSSFIGYSFGLI